MKVAAYSVALNEAENVRGWAEACAGADLLVIVDTGSTDGTVEFARELGITVHQIAVRPWRFDMARNAALALLPADIDVCLSVDLDERPDLDLFDKVRAAWTPETRRGWITMDTGFRWQANRLHARFGYHWVSPCHEVTIPYHGEPENDVVIDAVITHKQLLKDRAGYLPLLQMAVREDPQNARMWTYLTREFYYRAQMFPHFRPSVVEAARQTLERQGWAPERAAVCRWAALASDDPLPWLRRGVRECPGEPEPHLALARYYYEARDWPNLAEVTARAVDLPESAHYLNEPDAKWLLFDFDALANYHLGNHQRAISSGRRALELNPTDERLISNLGFYAA